MQRFADIRKIAGIWMYTFAGVAGIIAFWMVLGMFYPPAIIPPPERIGTALAGIMQAESFRADLAATLFRVIGCFVASFLVGLCLGFIAGVRRSVFDLLHPVMVLAESAPPVAWLVVAILLFGMGHAPSLLVGMSAAIPIFFFNTVSAVKGLDRNLLEMAFFYRVPKRRVFLSVYLPGILLHAVSASSSSLSIIWRVVIMAEAFTTASGIGPKLWGAYLYSDAEVVYAYIVLIVMLGFLLEFGVIKPISGWADACTRSVGHA
jgi:NitT/TauT family transport system permease protein